MCCLGSSLALIQVIQELIEKINTKSLEKLHRSAVNGYEITMHNKIRVQFANGYFENFGSIADCIEMLSVRYNLAKKEKAHILETQKSEINTIVMEGNTPLEVVVNVVDKALKAAQGSKSTIYQNKEEIVELIRHYRTYVIQSKQSELITAFAMLYKEAYANDQDMFIYFEAINKEIAEIFSRISGN